MYRLRFLSKALEDLRRIDRAHQKIIKEKLIILAENPTALRNNIKKIGASKDNLYRLRTGSYTVILKREEAQLLIIVVRIGHRREIYLKL